MEKEPKYKWTAKNNSSFLNGYRYAKTVRGAIRDARRYVIDELMGEGQVIVYELHPSGTWYPLREDEKSIRTNYSWKTIWEA